MSSVYLNLDEKNNGMVHISSMENHVMRCSVGEVIDGNVVSEGHFPPKKVEEDISIEDRLRDLLFRCMHFSSKLMGVCELSGEPYKEDNSNIICSIIKGSNGIVDYPYGSINYNKKYSDRMDILNQLFETKYNVIGSYRLNNVDNFLIEEEDIENVIKLTIKRSNGDMDDNSRLDLTQPLKYLISKSRGKIVGLAVKVLMSDNEWGEKFVSLQDIKLYNPSLFPIVLFISDNIPEWMDSERLEWYGLMITNITNMIGANGYDIVHT